MIEPDVATETPAAPQSQSLHALLGGSDGRYTVVHLRYLCVDAIVLARRDRQVELLFDGGNVGTLYDAAVAQLVDEPDLQASLLLQALAHQHQQLVAMRSRADTFIRRIADTMANVRRHMIDLHRSDTISRSQLDDFLKAFDLPPFEAPTRVSFTISGTYLVDNGDLDAVHHDGQDHLGLVFDRLRDVVPDSDIYTVTIDNVTPTE